MKQSYYLSLCIIVFGVVSIYNQYRSRPAPVRLLPPMATLTDVDRLDADHFIDNSHTALADVALSSEGLCPGDTSFTCRNRLIQLQRQVVQDYPIPIPQPNVPAPMPASEAVARYKKYMADNAGDPKLFVFKQLYPRILLNKYGVLASQDHALIRYFTEHMLEAHAQDFATLAKALPSLKADVPADQYNQWLAVTIREAEAQQANQQQTIAALQRRIAHLKAKARSDDKERKSLAISLTFLLEHLEHSSITADLTALRKLRQADRV
ncbi:hypothetical protein [Fibrella aquatilis]|uniref:Lipase chaperone n=1 Tax=Fibrella aquatilis TaxID=2817059 RepID=A0A939G1T7_9BACT|nr:hypothetical protein [Fibrella aquatilis]MBO0930454.1 hypothetical protein [Fibrella aquatilis]